MKSIFKIFSILFRQKIQDHIGETVKNADSWEDMIFINRGHLGGYVKSDPVNWPHGDPMTYTPELWDWLVDQYNPRVFLDVGCAEGHAVKHMLEKGCEAWGIDGCLEVFKTAVVPQDRIIIHDYSHGPVSAEFNASRPDMVYSCEFVEHVERIYMENFLKTFDLARVVCFTHAFEDQPGHHHVNCQAPEFWIAVMEERGFHWNEKASMISRRIAGKSHWERSGLIFTK